MFTVADIREIAVQIEKNGESAYRQAAQAVTDSAVSAVFSWMAAEEKRHGQWFASLGSGEPLTGEQLEIEKMGRKLLQEMVADQTFSLEKEMLLNTSKFDEALSQAQLFEEDTIMFYQFLLGLLEDDKAREQLTIIIDEEKRHVEQLAKMRETGPESGENPALS